MSNPYAEHLQAKAVARIADAAERIADALEAANAADPLTMLADLAEGDVMRGDAMEPMASNGQVHVYALPGTDDWHVVARRDANSESGYTVAIERA